MTVALAMIVKNEEAVIGRCLKSAMTLVDEIVVVDTGSSDKTREMAEDMGATVVEREWRSFGENLTEALGLAADADWILRLDADMTVEAHPDLKGWLDEDPDPTTDVWNVLVEDHGLNYRLPLLVRGGLEWQYRGATHEWLDAQGRNTRSLLGLTVVHHGDGANRNGKLERDIDLLADGVAVNDARSIFYTAECLRFLGRSGEAVEMYRRRVLLEGFEEERWWAKYQAAKLRKDVPGLLAVWRERPHRHEPLTAASQIVSETEHDDILFVQPAGRA